MAATAPEGGEHGARVGPHEAVVIEAVVRLDRRQL